MTWPTHFRAPYYIAKQCTKVNILSRYRKRCATDVSATRYIEANRSYPDVLGTECIGSSVGRMYIQELSLNTGSFITKCAMPPQLFSNYSQ